MMTTFLVCLPCIYTVLFISNLQNPSVVCSVILLNHSWKDIHVGHQQTENIVFDNVIIDVIIKENLVIFVGLDNMRNVPLDMYTKQRCR